MPLIAERLIADEIVKKTSCDRCNTEESLNVKVHSKFFALKILFFAYGKKVRIECTSCHRIEKDADAFPRRTKDRIEAVLEDAKHPWFLYSGYVVFPIFLILGLMNKS
ncbi:hypothetical protein KORDIASMS9_01259 [Kordia sp. SMS9]|uniref:hypothetical protein n=1 Tax=Kordia sp. SMS9 TaxID=2282170 RepID=UPI000E0E0805|nr:hypothetical protein [Kordia sp. SMS9]AXG69040.1 hypothetical protein KORDIASMS9_01259 [Kordia sp. SMS9]